MNRHIRLDKQQSIIGWLSSYSTIHFALKDCWKTKKRMHQKTWFISPYSLFQPKI